MDIKFESGLVADVEQTIIENLKQSSKNDCLLLDFSNEKLVQYIQLETLIYLVSFIAKRKSENFETKIKYFSNEKIRNFLHVARFFEVIKDLTGMSISEIAVELPDWFNTSKYAKDIFDQEKISFSKEIGNNIPLNDSERLEHYQNIGFYPLTSLPFKSEKEKSYTLKNEPNKWTESQSIVSVIQRNLPDKKVIIGDKISKHIIYESITNSVRHPESHNLVIASKKQNEYYTLIIWDDGKSIVDTLMNELKQGNCIKTIDSIEDIHSCYCIHKEEKKTGKPDVTDFDYYFSHEVPNVNEENYKKEEWFVLLSSLFPGITRDPKGEDFDKSILKEEERPVLTGRGLTYLINTAVRIFGGEVRIRTGNYFLNIQQANKKYKTLPNLFFDKYKNDYYVMDYKDKYASEDISPQEKIIIESVFKAKYEERGSFHGNMVTIHIPQEK
jgi:hypothetical protein